MNDNQKDDQIPAQSDDQNQPQDQPVNQPQDQPVTESAAAEEPKPDFRGIEVQQYGVPDKRPLASLEETLGEKPTEELPGEPEKIEKPPDQKDQKVVNFKPVALPPIKASSENRAVAITTTVAIIVLLAGFGAGFGGYKLFQGQITSADTETTPAAATEPPKTINTDTTQDKETANWSSYTNTKYKYALKYPDTWYGEGINSAESNTVQLTSFKPDTQTSGGLTEGSKVEIVFQDTNGKILKDWLDANNASMNAQTAEPKSLTIDEKSALQQTISLPVKSIGTYLIQADKVMIISYYAAEKDFDQGKTIYEDIIESITLD